MKTIPVSRAALASLAFAATAATAATAAPAPIFRLDVLDPLVAAEGINNRGDVVGAVDIGGGLTHAAVWTAGQVRDLGALRDSSVGHAIDGNGVVLGADFKGNGGRDVWWDAAGQPHLTRVLALSESGLRAEVVLQPDGGGRVALRGLDGQLVPLENFPTDGALPTALNDHGHVAGVMWPADFSRRDAFLWKDGALTELGMSATWTEVYAINGSDVVVGSLLPEGDWRTRAFRWEAGVVTLLGGADRDGMSQARDINDSGWIVGWSAERSGQQHAALWFDGQEMNLDDLLDASLREAGWQLTAANGVNDRGLIVGQMFNDRTFAHASFMLTPMAPVPEPGAFALAVMGLAAVAAIRHSRS